MSGEIPSAWSGRRFERLVANKLNPVVQGYVWNQYPSAPSPAPYEGYSYYDSTLHMPGWYNGTGWEYMGGSGGVTYPRVVTAGSTSGSITPTAATADTYRAVGLTGAITLAAPSGTPEAEQKLILFLKDNGSARGITWTTSSTGFRASVEAPLPSTTVAGKWMRIGCIWNDDDSYWDVVAVVNQA